MRRLKIKKNVLGEEYSFFITLQPNTFKCSYTIHFKNGEPLGATVTEDFGHIVLDTPIELDGYINGINPPKKMISKIKIPKDQKFKFKEEIQHEPKKKEKEPPSLFKKDSIYENKCLIHAPHRLIPAGEKHKGSEWENLLYFEVGENSFNDMFTELPNGN